MGNFSLMHWIVVALVILVLFGRGKISETMGDFGKGVKSFRKGLSEEEHNEPAKTAAQDARLTGPVADPVQDQHNTRV